MRSNRPEIISSDTLKQSYWLLGHLWQFKRNAIITIVVVEAIVIVLALIGLGGYVYYAAVRQHRIITPLRASAASPTPSIIIQEPTVTAYGAVSSGSGQVDLYARLKNPNQGWRADFDFIITVNGVDQQPQKMFLFPLEEKYALKSGVSAQSQPTLSTRIVNLGWQRLSAADIADITSRNIFEVKEIRLDSSQGPHGGARLTFSLINHSIYKFWDFRVPLVLKQGTAISAVALVPVFSIDREEEKHLEVSWELPVSATSFEIVPDIDVLDSSSLRPAL